MRFPAPRSACARVPVHPFETRCRQLTDLDGPALAPVQTRLGAGSPRLPAFLAAGFPPWKRGASRWGGIEGPGTSKAVPQAGVAVEARGAVMPRPRTAVTDAEGRYRLPMLVPGPYLLRVVAPGGGGSEVAVDVLLNQTAVVNLVLDDAHDGAIEEVQVAKNRNGEKHDTRQARTIVTAK